MFELNKSSEILADNFRDKVEPMLDEQREVKV